MAYTNRSSPRVENEGSPGPGRPRSDEAHRAILDATLQLLSDTGYERLTISAIATRAGVGKATIYRRWPSKAPLVIEALEQLPQLPCPDTGSLIDDLTLLIEAFVHDLRTTPLAGVLAVLGGERVHDPELSKLLLPFFLERRKPLQRVLERAVSRSELPPDIDLDASADVIMGPINTRFLFTGGDLDPSIIRPFVEASLFGIHRLRVPSGKESKRRR
jgi:AcrR family transcriptional regulator